MKTTPEYLFEMITELSQRLDLKVHGNLSDYQQLTIVQEMCGKYGALIDGTKIIKK